MRYALLHGATPAAAATYALAAPPARPRRVTPPAAIAPHTDRTTRGACATTDPPGLRREGPDLPLPRAGWQARSLARAATALDAEAVRGLLNESITAVGARITWDSVVRPVLGAIAQRWVDTGKGIEIEHLLSDCVTGVFSALAATAQPRPSHVRRPPVPFCSPGWPETSTGSPRRALRDPRAARCGLPVTGRRPACRRTGRGDPPYRTRRGTAVVTTVRHRRSRPARRPCLAPGPGSAPSSRAPAGPTSHSHHRSCGSAHSKRPPT